MTPIPPWVIAVVIAGAVLALLLVIRVLIARREDRLHESLRGQGAGASGTRATADSTADIVLPRVPRAEQESGLYKIDQGFERMIVRSGLDVSPNQALALTALIGVATFAVLYLWRWELWLATVGLAFAMGIPLAIFWFLESRYKTRMQSQLPDAFYVLARSLRAGIPLEQGLQLVADQGIKPLSDEFQRCSAQVRLGLTVPVALQNMAERVQLLDFNAFVSVITYYQGVGGNLPLLLDRLAASTRDRNQFRGQFFAVTAQARITAIFLGLFPFVILLGYAVFEPEHVRAFFTDPKGWLLLLIAFVLQLIGATWVSRLLRVAY